MDNIVSVSNLLSDARCLSPERRGAEFVTVWTQLVDAARVQPILQVFRHTYRPLETRLSFPVQNKLQ